MMRKGPESSKMTSICLRDRRRSGGLRCLVELKSMSQMPSLQQDHNCNLTFRVTSKSCFLGLM